jgi:hypothetical protein
VAVPVAPGARYCSDRPVIGTEDPPGFWISTKSWEYAAPGAPPSEYTSVSLRAGATQSQLSGPGATALMVKSVLLLSLSTGGVARLYEPAVVMVPDLSAPS